jgi:hypothetical protein
LLSIEKGTFRAAKKKSFSQKVISKMLVRQVCEKFHPSFKLAIPFDRANDSDQRFVRTFKFSFLT